MSSELKLKSYAGTAALSCPPGKARLSTSYTDSASLIEIQHGRNHFPLN
jgi:hypothetical protein